MFKTFGKTPSGDLKIASKAWSDFAATIPLIRSFSFGSNFPPQYPIFAGPHIRYHFGFYLVVGTLEKLGIPLNYALNIPSAIGFTLLLTAIYLFAKNIFKSRAAGIISAVFFLFNGSFAFIEFFKKSPVSVNTIKEIINNTSFSSFGPYDGKIVSAFWNLNIYTNQRHLAFAYAVFLTILLCLHIASKKTNIFSYKHALLLGICVGFFPFIHYAVFGMIGILIAISFLIYPKIRKQIFVTGAIALLLAIPQVLYMGSSALHIEPIKFGYLIENLSTKSFLNYWILNLGFVLPLSILGFLFSDKPQRKIFIPFAVLFIIGNVFQVSPEIAANHKFFNLYLIGAEMFAAHFLVIVWSKKLAGKITASLIFPFLILSGIIDFFPIINDSYIILSDIQNNDTARFIKENTPKDTVILNGSYLYDSASLAGRKIFMGWPYFSWSAGYDTDNRYIKMKSLLSPTDMNSLCRDLADSNISYVELQSNNPIEGAIINYDFYENNFRKIFTSLRSDINIYSVNESCQKFVNVPVIIDN